MEANACFISDEQYVDDARFSDPDNLLTAKNSEPMLQSEAEANPKQEASLKVIEGLFVQARAIQRHMSMPMLEEREAYLAYLLRLGRSRKYVINTATLVCHVLQHVRYTESLMIGESEISRASLEWASEVSANARGRANRTGLFRAAARNWFRFLGRYEFRPPESFRFKEYLEQYVSALQYEMHYQRVTIEGTAGRIKRFLKWVSLRRTFLASVTLEDVGLFLAEQKETGCGYYSIVAHCKSLRTFFGFAEQHGWNTCGLSKMIKVPRYRNRDTFVGCPAWKQVRAMLAFLDDSKPSHCRAKAILMLASIYGMRCSEIVRLTLGDLDWRNEILTVHRAKRGRTQQFPLQYEVGEAIIRYLRTVRPRSAVRNLFLTLKTPYRPVVHLSQSMVAFLRRTKAIEPPCGLHAFRHACATELLRKRTSLGGIADFLGHRGLGSVSIYAHCDLRTLRKVADFSLRSVL
ncbi:tyrosine-type recombinase/integrase [Acidicapsa dinghuensis]|uniref:Tyrosine-type recombinase/integrase n=1 Tax=Acidicapsa dinghuensis TaxID=2218256 RepID=A0ABW1ED63_9BACT|nr:tyrosine-type recombinase/integrase [Acidicapsa dinghuensis]